MIKETYMVEIDVLEVCDEEEIQIWSASKKKTLVTRNKAGNLKL